MHRQRSATRRMAREMVRRKSASVEVGWKLVGYVGLRLAGVIDRSLWTASEVVKIWMKPPAAPRTSGRRRSSWCGSGGRARSRCRGRRSSRRGWRGRAAAWTRPGLGRLRAAVLLSGGGLGRRPSLRPLHHVGYGSSTAAILNRQRQFHYEGHGHVYESQFEEELYNERREKLRQIGELGAEGRAELRRGDLSEPATTRRIPCRSCCRWARRPMARRRLPRSWRPSASRCRSPGA